MNRVLYSKEHYTFSRQSPSNTNSIFTPEEKILRVPKEYVLRVLNSTGALIREECEIECSRGIFTASPGKHCIYPNNVDCIYSD